MVMGKTKVGTLNEILATRAKMSFPYRFNISSRKTVNEILDIEKWCKNNCKGVWRSNMVYNTYFQFELDNDALMFSLKWASVIN